MTIGGITIDGGLLYVGTELRSVRFTGPEPALIDPTLPVALTGPAITVTSLGFWPSYAYLEPEQRGTYLQWLADGRRAPDADPGCLFLYYAGLERRLLVDAPASPAAAAERPILAAEISRLLDLYGDETHFGRYPQGLVDLLMAEDSFPRRYLLPPPTVKHGWELPVVLEVKLALGQLAADQKPVPLEWALAWLRMNPWVSLRVPATRCPEEFQQVFDQLYQQRFGEGMVLKPGRRKLREVYMPINRGMSGQQYASKADVPDVTGEGSPLEVLREVADTACDRLDAYSRYLGRHPDGAGSAAAVALLPTEVHGSLNTQAEALLESAAAADRHR